MDSPIKTSPKFKPLWDWSLVDEKLGDYQSLDNDELAYYLSLFKVDKVVMTGGRYSAKSFEVADWAVDGLIHHDYKILYTRFTNVSMSDSVVPEIQEKVELNHYEDYVRFANNKYKSTCGDGLISFKGIKSGSGGQTANLKSLKNFNVQVTDEAEEIPDYKTFEKTYFSIRSIDKRNLSILILNPVTTDFWIFEEFFSGRGVQEGFNGIKDDILYIHTSYLDVDKRVLPANFIAAFEKMKVRRPNDYNEIVLGGWVSDLKGALYKKEEIERFSIKDFNLQNVEAVVSFVDVADRGTDALSMPVGFLVGDLIYIYDWYFSTENQGVTIPEISFKALENKIEHMAVEVNGVGGGYLEELQKVVGCQTYPFSQQSNKHSRIVQNSGFVRNYMVFRNDYEAGSHYDKAMREFFAYMKDDKLNKKNTAYNDDAPDSIAGLWVTCKDLFPDRWI